MQGEGAELRTRFERDLPHIRADDFRQDAGLENLIGNAIEFSPRGTVVTVQTRRADTNPLCEISDTGPGMPVPETDRLFTEYAPISNQPTSGEQGASLRLAISPAH